MEAAGLVVSAVSITTIWKACLFAFDMVDASKKYNTDIDSLLVKLLVERVRLYQWGDAIGLIGERGRQWKVKERYLQNAIDGLLRCINQAFDDTIALQEKYGLVEISALTGFTSSQQNADRDSSPATPQGAVDSVFKGRLAYSSHQRRTVKSSLAQRTKWIVRDKAKFSLLVAEIKGFIDGLYSILHPELRIQAQHTLQEEINSSDNIESLQTIQSGANLKHDDSISICISQKIISLQETATASSQSSFYAVDMKHPTKLKDSLLGAGDEGFDILEEQAGLNVKYLSALAHLLEKRTSIEDMYIAELNALIIEVAGDGELNSSRNLSMHLVDNISQQVDAHRRIALTMHGLRVQTEQILHYHTELSRELKGLQAILESKNELELRVIDAEKECKLTQIQVETYANQLNVARNGHKAMVQASLREELKKVDDLKRSYHLSVSRRNEIKRNWSESWTEFCERYETEERRRLHLLSNCYVKYGDAVSDMTSDYNKMAEKLQSVAFSFDPEYAFQELVANYRTADTSDCLEDFGLGFETLLLPPDLGILQVTRAESGRGDGSPSSSLQGKDNALSYEMSKENQLNLKSRKTPLSEKAKSYFMSGNSADNRVSNVSSAELIDLSSVTYGVLGN